MTWDLPAIVLCAGGLLAVWVLWRAQSRPDFDVARMLRDSDGKESAVRLFGFGAFAVHSWVIVYVTIGKTVTDNMLVFYGVTWSGSVIASKAIEAFAPRKPDQPNA